MDITLLSVNWSQRKVMELMLKSYVRHHWKGTPLKLMLVDNASEDDSPTWLRETGVPFITMDSNIGHENALNKVYDLISTKYCLLVDTDVEFQQYVWGYVDNFVDRCISAGELITRDKDIKPRISPWFWLFDIDIMRSEGITVFRDPYNTDWSMDVGSWHWQQMYSKGYFNHQISMIGGSIDGMPGMIYDWGVHYGKCSWDRENHQDRKYEISQRIEIIHERLALYDDIKLEGKFTH